MSAEHNEPECSSGVASPRLFFIGNDNSGHTYVVPQEYSAEFWEWVGLPDDDESGWQEPSFCTRINGSQLLFERPRIFDGSSVVILSGKDTKPPL